MARKTLEVRITSGTSETNRDHGKLFLLTEMGAFDAEMWAADAFQGLVRAGVDVPDDLSSAGIVAIAQMGLKALGGIPKEDLRDLMDRMMKCVTYYPDPQRREVNRPPSPFMSDFEEISTLLTLRQEVLKLHADFLMAGVQSLGSPTPAPALN